MANKQDKPKGQRVQFYRGYPICTKCGNPSTLYNAQYMRPVLCYECTLDKEPDPNTFKEIDAFENLVEQRPGLF